MKLFYFLTKNSPIKSQAQSILNSSTLENIEIEYIKNLQQQVYFLEMECNYLYPFFVK